MDETAENQHQVHRVRRGRPPKIKAEGQPKPEGYVASGDYWVDREPMNSLAKRIWDGQCPDLYESERVERILTALKAKGYDLDGLEIPGVNMKKYL